MFRFVFSSIESSTQVRALVDFLHLQNLKYPNYSSWVERAEAELHSGYKRAILALSEGRIIGNVVYQPHKSMQGLLEIKNLRVDQRYRLRHFGAFMLKQVEAENSGFIGAIGDIRPGQDHIVQFMQECGYRVIGKADLYDGQQDRVVAKGFRRDLQQIIQSSSLLPLNTAT